MLIFSDKFDNKNIYKCSLFFIPLIMNQNLFAGSSCLDELFLFINSGYWLWPSLGSCIHCVLGGTFVSTTSTTLLTA